MPHYFPSYQPFYLDGAYMELMITIAPMTVSTTFHPNPNLVAFIRQNDTIGGGDINHKTKPWTRVVLRGPFIMKFLLLSSALPLPIFLGMDTGSMTDTQLKLDTQFANTNSEAHKYS
jgi:hypothetical protein